MSCRYTAKTADNTISFDTIRVNETQPLGKGNSNAVLCCRLNINFTYPNVYNNPDKQHKLQAVFIESMFSVKYAGLSPQQAVDSFKNQYVKYLQCEKIAEEDYNLDDETEFQYYLNLNNEITYCSDNLISFLVETENFEGGAHGSHSILGYVIDLNTGEFITEDSFAGIGYKKNVSDIIIKKIAESEEIDDPKQLEDIGYNNISDIVPNGNFTISKEGITYYFNDYEIAAYLIGITKVFILYEELENFIVEDNPISILTKL
jgi:hypothetical protein